MRHLCVMDTSEYTGRWALECRIVAGRKRLPSFKQRPLRVGGTVLCIILALALDLFEYYKKRNKPSCIQVVEY